MKLRSIQSRLNDILVEIDGAAETIGDASFETFVATFYMPRTVERCIEIVSEATRHIPDDLKQNYPGIPWRQIAGIGNFLRHEYDIVDPRIIWNIVKVHFPRLRSVIEELQMQSSSEGKITEG